MIFRSLRYFSVLVMVAAMWTSAMSQTGAFDTSRMNRSADACDDFFEYANGTWVKNTQIPPSQSRWGSFNILSEANRDVLHDILEKAAANKKATGNEKLIGDFYASCMDEAGIEKAGTTAIKPTLAAIAKMRSADDVKREIADLQKGGVGVLFRFGGGPDPKDSNMVIVNAGQGGLSLARDNYMRTDARSAEVRTKFVEHMTNMFKLAGDSPEQAAAEAKTVMDMQMRIAKFSKSPADLRDPDKNYNKIPVADAQAIISNLDLKAFMARRGIPPVTEINFTQPDFFKEVNTMLGDTPVDAWKSYFRWNVLSSSANFLPKAFRDESFNFNGRVLQGTTEQQERWKQCVSATDGALGEALGQEFAKREFNQQTRTRANEMMDDIFAAMKTHIENLTWMSAETKTKALAKLAAYKRKIGVNDHPRGYAGVKVDRKKYAGNELAVRVFQSNRNLADIGKATDKTRWGMNPQIVNASYNPTYNDVTLPAGIIRPPFFSFQADDAINYGGLGAVIGHEISHGFDDQGSKFGPDGNLKSWWTPEDRTKFEERAQCVIDQFNGYEVVPGYNVNGRLTLGENIGDLGGLNIAYTALQEALKKHPQGLIDGFTPEQRFFLGWAQVWASKATPQFLSNQTLTDPHSWARFRVNGPTSNMPEFAKAFGCKQGQKMVREKFCQIW
ncbi:MAG: M13 family metallopeptidase [Acidobacteria bacterium]|nr:M13 family metallopeptidase [Acidobacteriota bacterium]